MFFFVRYILMLMFFRLHYLYVGQEPRQSKLAVAARAGRARNATCFEPHRVCFFLYFIYCNTNIFRLRYVYVGQQQQIKPAEAAGQGRGLETCRHNMSRAPGMFSLFYLSFTLLRLI